MITNYKRVCIFVDGENLRHSIVELFSTFNQYDYLPKNADWGKLFDWIVHEISGDNAERIRTYWYVVKNIDFSPYSLNSIRKDLNILENVLSRDSENEKKISGVSGKKREEIMNKIVDELIKSQSLMQNRFFGWINIQDIISGKYRAIEFRRAGAIRYDLFKKTLGSEKAVDIKLATDLIRLKDIYDVAVIVSGDQDYVPAVEAIKDLGKHVVSVAFQKKDGNLLPGGAKRLNQTTDWNLEIKHEKLKEFLKIT